MVVLLKDSHCMLVMPNCISIEYSNHEWSLLSIFTSPLNLFVPFFTRRNNLPCYFYDLMLEWSKSERYVNSLSLYTMKFRDWRYYLIDSKDLEFKIYLDFPQFKLSNGGSHITLYLLCYNIISLFVNIFRCKTINSNFHCVKNPRIALKLEL